MIELLTLAVLFIVSGSSPASAASLVGGKPWSKGTVPYFFDEKTDFQSEYYIDMEREMSMISRFTCVQFVREINMTEATRGTEPSNYCWVVGEASADLRILVDFYLDQSCFASVGETQANLTLTGRCMVDRESAIDSIQHELLHVLGFKHEHQRPDRDLYVFINYTQLYIEQNTAYVRLNYDILAMNNENYLLDNEPYDHTSVMHYSKNKFISPVLPSIDENDFGRSNKQSAYLFGSDLRGLRKLYKCADSPYTEIDKRTCIDEVPYCGEWLKMGLMIDYLTSPFSDGNYPCIDKYNQTCRRTCDLAAPLGGLALFCTLYMLRYCDHSLNESFYCFDRIQNKEYCNLMHSIRPNCSDTHVLREHFYPIGRECQKTCGKCGHCEDEWAMCTNNDSESPTRIEDLSCHGHSKNSEALQDHCHKKCVSRCEALVGNLTGWRSLSKFEIRAYLEKIDNDYYIIYH